MNNSPYSSFTDKFLLSCSAGFTFTVSICLNWVSDLIIYMGHEPNITCTVFLKTVSIEFFICVKWKENIYFCSSKLLPALYSYIEVK